MRVFIHFILVVLTGSILAQDKVTGKVVDADTGEGLIGAHIYLMKDWRNGTTAGIDGSFELSLDLSSGDSLIVTFVGFKEVLLPVARQMTIRMEPIELVGEDVVISTKRLIAEEFKYLQVSKIEIYTNPAAKADPVLAVNSLPSSTTTDESANISLRGSSPIETSIFLNNVPIYDAVRYSQLNGIGTFSIFNTSIIQDLVVFPGNPPLEFGNTTSGIISLKTDERVLEGSTNSILLSLASIGISREQKINKNQSIKFFSNWQPSGAIKAVNEAALREIKSFESGDLGIYWYGSSNDLNWKVLSYSNIEGYEFNFRHPSYNGVFDQNKKRSFLVSSVEKSLGNGTISLNNGLTGSDGSFAFSNTAFNVDKFDFFGSLNYLNTTSKFSWKSGISYDYRQSSVDGNFHEFFYALDVDHPTIFINETAKSRTLEGFSYFKYFLSEAFTLGTGLRKNLPVDDQRSYLSSQLNLSYTNAPWSIILGAGKYHKNGLIENTGEPFESESDQLSADFKYEKENVQVALSFFGKDNQIDSGSYNANGIEFFVDYRFSTKLRASASITWLDASSNNMPDYQYDLSYFIRGNLAYTPGSLWTIEAILVAREGTSYSPVSLALFDTSLAAYEPIYAELDSRLPAYSNLGISVSKIFSLSDQMNLIAFASLNNVLDHENIRTQIYNEDYSQSTPAFFSRRTSYVGVMINF